VSQHSIPPAVTLIGPVSTPTEEQFYNVSSWPVHSIDQRSQSLHHSVSTRIVPLMSVDQSLSPDLKRKVDEIRAQREGGATIRDKLAVSRGLSSISYPSSIAR
jgi:hypothetical protein